MVFLLIFKYVNNYGDEQEKKKCIQALSQDATGECLEMDQRKDQRRRNELERLQGIL